MRHLLAALLALSPALAQAPPGACSTLAHRQFDFWAGDWVVTDPTGKPAGTNRIDLELDGCVLHENWVGAKGMRGQSLNYYDPARKTWTQSWIGSDGGSLILTGGWNGSSMVLEGTAPGSDGKPAKQRITWTPRPDGTVRQHWESSADGGRKWTTVFDGVYAKR